MENEVREKFLPLGTVVLLKNGTKELMIMSYCVIPTGEIYDKNGRITDTLMLDYGACAYPEGMVSSDQLFAFNHEQIEKVCFMGYETEKFKALNKALVEDAGNKNELLEKIKAAKKQMMEKNNKTA